MRRAARYVSLLAPLMLVLAFGKYHAARVADPAYDFTGSDRFAWSLAYAAVLALASYGVGLPELANGRRQAAAQAFAASALAALAVSVVQLAVGDALLPRFVVFGAAGALLPVNVAASAVSRIGRRADEGRDRVVLVGSQQEFDLLAVDLGMAPERPAVLAACVPLDEATDPSGSGDHLGPHVVHQHATVLVLDREALLDSSVIDQASPLHEGGVRVRTLLEFYEQWLGKLPVGELERASLFFDIAEVHRLRYGRIKRLIDVVGAALGLVPLLASVPFVFLANLAGNRGPLLYRQERVGRAGERFEILKFRTMVPTGPDVTETSWTTVDDPRITAFGRFLRRTHVDELPQVVNILRGDLSIVGPRPEQPRYVEELSAKLPFYGMRHLVRPGLTGWAQVKYGYAGDERDALEKLQYEFFYLRHQSLRFDLRVIGRTVRSVSGGSGSGR